MHNKVLRRQLESVDAAVVSLDEADVVGHLDDTALAAEAGLVADERFQAKFPPSELATIRINFFASAE